MNPFKKKKPDILKIKQETTQTERPPLPPPPPPPPPTSVQRDAALPQQPISEAVTLEIIFQALQEIYEYLNQLGTYVYEKLEDEKPKDKPKK